MSRLEEFVAIAEHGLVPKLHYNDFVAKLAKPMKFKDHLNHMALGAAGEVGELVDCIKKYTIYEKDMDYENLKEELGDLMFYMQGIMNCAGLSWQDLVNANVTKLSKRYEKLTFSTEAAVARADKQTENK
jgi:NTP pyrophosphatase (non-canonical NTP hydrolase)